jgi:hypothetical protein
VIVAKRSVRQQIFNFIAISIVVASVFVFAHALIHVLFYSTHAMALDHGRDPCPYVILNDFGGAFAMGVRSDSPLPDSRLLNIRTSEMTDSSHRPSAEQSGTESRAFVTVPTANDALALSQPSRCAPPSWEATSE